MYRDTSTRVKGQGRGHKCGLKAESIKLDVRTDTMITGCGGVSALVNRLLSSWVATLTEGRSTSDGEIVCCCSENI